MSEINEPTVEQIEALTGDQIARIMREFDMVGETPAFRAAMGAVAHLIDHTDPTAAALDNAARKRARERGDDTTRLLYSVRWAYQASLHADALGEAQVAALIGPWSARSGGVEGRADDYREG